MRHIMFCFPEGKFKALTLSYDDGRNADRRLVDIFNANNLKATFHLNSGLFDADDHVPADQIDKLYAGHEVAVHTYSHPTIARCSRELIIEQVLQDRKNLEMLVGYPVRGMSYPNGSYNTEIKKILPLLGIEYSRITGNSASFLLPDDMYQWQATCHHKYKLLDFCEEFIGLHKKQYLYLFYVWGHSYEFDNDDNWSLIERFAAAVSGSPDIWYATNIQIADYLAAARNLKFSADSSLVYNPSAASVWLNSKGQVIEVNGGNCMTLE